MSDFNPQNDQKGYDDHASFDETCFEAWKNKWGRTYATREEEISRFQIFKQSLRAEEPSYTGPLDLPWTGLTDFADMSFEQFKIERLGFNSVDDCFSTDSESDDEMLAKNGMKRYFSFRMDDGTMHSIPSYPTNVHSFDFKGFLEDLKRQGKVPMPVIEKLRLKYSDEKDTNVEEDSSVKRQSGDDTKAFEDGTHVKRQKIGCGGAQKQAGGCCSDCGK